VIRRLVPGPPLDVAADARRLRLGHGLAGDHRIGGRAQVLARRRDVVAGPRAVELPAIDQLPVPIEKEEIRRAGSLKRLRDLLCLVEQVRERETGGLRLLLHALRAVLWVTANVVRSDGDYPEPARAVFLPELPELFLDELHKRAMGGDERDQQACAIR